MWVNWLLLHTMSTKWMVSIFNTLSFHCIHGTQTVCSKSCPPNHVSLLCVPRLSLADLSSQKEEMTAESVLGV